MTSLTITHKDFDTNFQQLHPKLFSMQLRQENCFNPLIAKNDCFFQKDLHEKPLPKGLSTVECLNEEWSGALRFIREAIEQKKIDLLIYGLEEIHKLLDKSGVPFSDFIRTTGIFARCKWIYSPGTEKIQDVFYPYCLPVPGDWQGFISDGRDFREKILACLATLGKLKPDTYGADEFKHAVDALLQGAVTENVFERLRYGIMEAGRLFDKEGSANVMSGFPLKKWDDVAYLEVKGDLTTDRFFVRIHIKNSKKTFDVHPHTLPKCGEKRWTSFRDAVCGTPLGSKEVYNLNQSFRELCGLDGTIFDRDGKIMFKIKHCGKDSLSRTKRNEFLQNLNDCDWENKDESDEELSRDNSTE